MNRREFVTLAAAGSVISAVPGALLAQAAPEVNRDLVKTMVLGKPDAPVTVTEYAWFTCPHCADFHASTWPRLKADYIDTGKVKFEFREVYFGQDPRPGLWPGLVARCGDEVAVGDNTERYFGIVDLIYDKQNEWARAESAADMVDQLRRIGKTVGLSDAMLDECFKDQAKAMAMYTVAAERVEKDGVTGTPTFFIDGKKFEGGTWNDLFAQIDAKAG